MYADMDAEEKAVLTLRCMAVDQIDDANSGHPGLPLGAADIAFTLFHKFLRFDPTAPKWPGRDRFVLSAGHGSAMLYALLHLYGYDVPMGKGLFRQLGTILPGHPEFGLTPGVETTTGPLGQGIANGVGMALASKMLTALVGDAEFSPADYRVVVLCGDGCLMEGISHEVCALAGVLQLDNLFLVHDDNKITIDGSTEQTFTEDVVARFAAYDWFAMRVNGHDRQNLQMVLGDAQRALSPAFISARTTIGYGSSKQGTAACHGSPLGVEETRGMKDRFGWPQEPEFFVPDDVRELFATRAAELRAQHVEWEEQEQAWRERSPAKAALWDKINQAQVPADLMQQLLKAVGDEARATRVHSSVAIQVAAELLPGMVSGSADLQGSCKTDIVSSDIVAADDFDAARSIRFGVREFGMAGIANGMVLSGLTPVVSTFFTFLDYMKPAVRMAALMELGTVFVFTHDSIYVGEDGPTHQPVEQLAALRAMPNLVTLRPADGLETAAAWAIALDRSKKGLGPTALVLTRQKVPVLTRPEWFREEHLRRGGYIVRDASLSAHGPVVNLIATGSEVALAMEVAERLDLCVISMPSVELFLSQDRGWQRSVLRESRRTVVIEASHDPGWHRFAGRDGLVIGMDSFGASGPADQVAERFGFTVDAVCERITSWMAH